MPSVRESILARVKVLAATMPGFTAYRCQRSIGASDLPAVTVWDRQEISERAHSGYMNSLQVDLELQDDAAGQNDEALSTRVSEMLAALQVALCSGDATLGALIQGIAIAGSVPSYPDAGGNVVGVTATYIITYNTARSNPATTL